MANFSKEESVKIHHAHELIAVRGKFVRQMETVELYLSDAKDAIDIDRPDIALQRIRMATELIKFAKT